MAKSESDIFTPRTGQVIQAENGTQYFVCGNNRIKISEQYVNPTELTAELLNTLIEKILIHEAVKSEDGSREQEVEIFYRFIGKIE